jgi:glycosyltransferase involved in cell wall biosynthesis
MRILFFIESLRSGGKERRLTELMKVLNQEKDIQFELAVMNKDVHYQEVQELGIKIHYLIRKTKKDYTVFGAFYKLCKTYRPDIVHCWDSMTTIYSIPICKLLKIKLINGMIFNAPKDIGIFSKTGFRARITFPFSDIIIGNSQMGIKVYKAPRFKTFCIHNGFNFERIKNLVNQKLIRNKLNIDSVFVIGMVASYTKNKDYKTYFDAASMILKSRKDVTFLAIGEGTELIKTNNLLQPQLSQHFRFLGKIDDIESTINIMDVCVLSTYTEGISNAILEYMALGKPVIATSGGGTSEILTDHETGYLISPANPKELADKIEILLKDHELRLNMGKAGKERIHNFFSIEKMVSQYISIFKSTITQN